MSTNKRERDRDTPRSLASSESPQTMIQDDELGRLPLRDDVDFSTQAYLDQANQSVTNESSPDSDHIFPPNSQTHHSNRHQHQQVPDDHHVQSSHNTNNYSNEMSEEESTIAQGFPLNPSIGTGHMMFDPDTLTNIPPTTAPTTHGGILPSIDVGRPSHSSFRGIS
jgi:hypothetical protein